MNVCPRREYGAADPQRGPTAALEGTSELSTLGQPHIEPAWKQEVNRRLAAHKSRKTAVPVPSAQTPAGHNAGSRAAEAAARVAARYSKAPTYSQMQAEEARLAVRHAEIATQVALQAQAVAESALAELHAAADQPLRGPAVVESITREPRVESVLPPVAAPPAIEPISAQLDAPAVLVEETPAAEQAASLAEPILAALPDPIEEAPVAPQPAAPPVITHEVIDGRSFDLRWEPDLPLRRMERKPAPQPASEPFELATEDWWTPAEIAAEPIHIEAQSVHANLIEFPRELVAARKMRPRLAEAPAAAEPEAQLSIFEVDPGAISTEPAPVLPASEPEVEQWTPPEWSGIQLDSQADVEEAWHPAPEPEPQGPYLAPLGLRLMATIVDGSAILGTFFAAAAWASSRMQHVPALKTAEALAVLGLLLTGIVYHAVFFGLGKVTPGMKYAGIALSTFDDEVPNRLQLRRRLGAMVLSLLPVGLGFAWALFDDDRLSWHDRISGTYLRKR